jgi:glycosyltransferase involved in cell wall biosynthesis
MHSWKPNRRKRRILVLGSQTFLSNGPRVGIQTIAGHLASNGHEVHYVSSPSSPLDALFRSRRRRFELSWLRSRNGRQFPVAENLTEHIPRVPFPVNRRFWISKRQLGLFSVFLPEELTANSFDLCLHDTSPTHLFLEKLNVGQVILRLNDHPEGFSFHVAKSVTERLIQRIDEGYYCDIWPVTKSLNSYVKQLGCNSPSILLPNGVEIERFKIEAGTERRPKSAVFIGAIERWVDLHLLQQTAKLLPDWTIDLYGPVFGTREPTAANMRFNGAIPFDSVPATLARYSVGLIPFKDDKLTSAMEVPLKFFEYLAAGLGIAATDVGGLKEGMGRWSTFGNTAESYATALQRAAENADTALGERQEYLSRYSWKAILKQMEERIEELW